jgi:hypothetical protein
MSGGRLVIDKNEFHRSWWPLLEILQMRLNLNLEERLFLEGLSLEETLKGDRKKVPQKLFDVAEKIGEFLKREREIPVIAENVLALAYPEIYKFYLEKKTQKKEENSVDEP